MKVLSFLLGFILGGLFIAFVAVYGFGEEEEPEKQYVEIISLDIARYAFEKSHQKPLATRTEIRQSLMTDLG